MNIFKQVNFRVYNRITWSRAILDNLEKIILDKIDGMKDDIIKFLQQIIQIPSENPPGKYKEISKFVENKMKNIGLTAKIIRNNVIGELKNEISPSLIVYSHLDTVEASAGWTKDPFGGEIIENKIYGRGACDDKACVTAEIFATKALIESGIKLNGKLTLASVIDEESGGYKGAGYLLNKNIIKGDACLLGDGHGDYPVAYYGGCVLISFQISRKQVYTQSFSDIPKYHNKYSGVNAIQKMIKILNFLTELQEEFNNTETKYHNFSSRLSKTSILNLSKIQGGDKIGTLPNNCILHCVINTIPEQDIESIKTRILNFVEDLKRKDSNLSIKIQIPFSYEPYIADINSKFAKIVKSSAKTVFKEDREFKFYISANDAHFFVEKGIDTILFGTGSVENNLHAPDEFVEIEDLINTTKMFAMVILNYLR